MSSLTIPNNDNIDDETPTTPVQRVLNENNTNYYCTNDAINLNSNINQYESDSIVERVIYIQNWYRKYNKLLVLKEKLLSIHDITVNISNLLQKLKNSEALSSFDEAQAALLSERSSKHFTNFLSILPSDPNMKDPKKGRNFRMISSALLIAKYPSEILLSDGTIDQSIETRNCYFTASILFNSLLKFVNTIISASQDKSKLSLRKFRSLLINYRYSCRSYLDAFEIWRVIDGERVVRTLEESLYQSYSVLIATKASILFDNADPSLQPVAELQVEKIKATIVKVLGPHKSVARIEEITASIEASMPQFEMIKQYEDRLNGTIKKEKAMIMAAEAKDHSSATDQTKVSEENNVGMDAETEERMKEGIKLRDIIFTIDAKTQHSFAGMLPSVSASSATSAAAGSTSSDETTNSLLLEQSKSALVLRKVSDISGLSNERLAYEITLNKYYRIPTDIDPEIGGALS